MYNLNFLCFPLLPRKKIVAMTQPSYLCLYLPFQVTCPFYFSLFSFTYMYWNVGLVPFYTQNEICFLSFSIAQWIFLQLWKTIKTHSTRVISVTFHLKIVCLQADNNFHLHINCKIAISRWQNIEKLLFYNYK